MKKLYKNYLLFPAVVAFGYLNIHSATGPAGTFSANVTGAPFDAGTCNNCHFGGSWSPSVSLQLYSGATPVSVYTPGASYTLRITRTASAALPASGGFGFQLTCATGPGNTNYNNWGTLPANTTNIFLSGHNYIEHVTKLSKTISQINIPWTAPPSAAAGTVDFWIALNTVDGSTDAKGDDVVNTVLSINPNPLAVRFLYFRGKETDEGIALEWDVADDKYSDNFIIERSSDGKQFQNLIQIEAHPDGASENHYSYLDRTAGQQNFYKIRHTDIAGTESFFHTLSFSSRQPKDDFRFFATTNGIRIRSQQSLTKDCDLLIYNMNGAIFFERTISAQDLNSGELIIPKPAIPGLYFIQLHSGNTTLHTEKLLVP